MTDDNLDQILKDDKNILDSKFKKVGEDNGRQAVAIVIAISIFGALIATGVEEIIKKFDKKNISVQYEKVDGLKGNTGITSSKNGLYIDEYNRIERLKTLNTIYLRIDDRFVNRKPFIYHDRFNILQSKEYKGMFKDYVINEHSRFPQNWDGKY